MVELCELKMFTEQDQWPADIDTRIANLDFGGDSVLFESFDPSVSTDSLDSAQLREQCRPRTDDYQMTFADSGHWQSGQQLTTWGRIHSIDPLDEKTVSAPDIGPARSGNGQPRPSSLLANFVDSRRSETRFVDLNDNEIAADAAGLQRADRWRTRAATVPLKPKRTFADLQKNMAPELQFLALPHQMPDLCESSCMSLSDAMLKVQREGVPKITSDLDLSIPNLLQDDSPDSGLGCSGPIHIEDWASLSLLLPKHVADACSFFKSNAQLLQSSHSNCIDRSRRTEPCTTCFRVRRKVHPPNWAHSDKTRHVLCDCTASECLGNGYQSISRGRRSILRPCLLTRELSVVGLPIYEAKRSLVENVVEAVATIARGESVASLVLALQSLIADGLRSGVSTWNMITTVTAPGPATKNVHNLVEQLKASKKSELSCVEIFFERLLQENSLDCWLCYVVLKENVLQRLYDEGGFLVAAPTAYRSLLWRLVDSLALIPVLEVSEHSQQTRSLCSGPSRIASDSRVPKSSSVPARLSVQTHTRPSKIPLPKRRTCLSRTMSVSSLSPTPLASAISDYSNPGHLFVSKGEQLRVLSRRGPIARCSRIHPLRSHVFTGIVPLNNLLIK